MSDEKKEQAGESLMTVLEYCEHQEIEVLTLDGFEDCVIGASLPTGFFSEDEQPRLVYDAEKIVKKLMSDGISREDAEEYFQFNIIGAYVGKKTPMFVCPLRHD
jgi:hypothetical protein